MKIPNLKFHNSMRLRYNRFKAYLYTTETFTNSQIRLNRKNKSKSADLQNQPARNLPAEKQTAPDRLRSAECSSSVHQREVLCN